MGQNRVNQVPRQEISRKPEQAFCQPLRVRRPFEYRHVSDRLIRRPMPTRIFLSKGPVVQLAWLLCHAVRVRTAAAAGRKCRFLIMASAVATDKEAGNSRGRFSMGRLHLLAGSPDQVYPSSDSCTVSRAQPYQRSHGGPGPAFRPQRTAQGDEPHGLLLGIHAAAALLDAVACFFGAVVE